MNQPPTDPGSRPHPPAAGSGPGAGFNPASDPHLEPTAPESEFTKAITADDDAAPHNPFLERIRAIREQVNERMAAVEERMQEDKREFEESARSGELGPQWRTTQERIDAGETDLRSVLKGEDDDPAAQRIYGTVLPTLEEVDEAAAAQREEAEGR